MIELITNIGLLSAVMYLLILLYLIIGIIRMKTELTDEKPFVSVIVAAHNDAKSKLKKKTSEEISKVTGDVNLPPGFKLPF